MISYGAHTLGLTELVAYDDMDRVICLSCRADDLDTVDAVPLFVSDLLEGGNYDPAGWVCEGCERNLCEQSDAGQAVGYVLVYDDGTESEYLVSDSLPYVQAVADDWRAGWVDRAVSDGASVMLAVFGAVLPVRVWNRIQHDDDPLTWWDVNSCGEIVQEIIGGMCAECNYPTVNAETDSVRLCDGCGGVR